MNEQNSPELEIVGSGEPALGNLGAMHRAEVDMQVATAKRWPRVLSKVKSDMLGFATLDEETAKSCFYKLPRGGKVIEGPSVRLAEIAVACYGNLRVATQIMETNHTGDNPHVVVVSTAFDLEKNTAVAISKRRRITQKKDRDGGRKPVDDDDIQLAVNGASAIAFRDAVFKVVPRAIVDPVTAAAKRAAIGDLKTLAERRGKAMDHFAKIGIQKDRILQSLGKRSIEDLGLEDLELLIGTANALRDGDIKVDDAFPIPSTDDGNDGNKPEAPKLTANPTGRRRKSEAADPGEPTKAPEPTTTPQPTAEPAPATEANLASEPANPEPAGQEAPQIPSALYELSQLVRKAGKTFNELLMSMENSGMVSKTERQAMKSYDDIPEPIAKLCVRQFATLAMSWGGAQ